MHAKYSHINVSPSVISLLYFLCVEFRKEFFLLRALTIGYLHLLKVLHSTLGVVQHPITNTLGVLIWSMCVSTRKGASIHPFFNSVHKTYKEPQDHLYHILLAFLRQAEPRPTWRVVIDALRSPVVNQSRLAEMVEAAHLLDPTAIRKTVPGTFVCVITMHKRLV